MPEGRTQFSSLQCGTPSPSGIGSRLPFSFLDQRVARCPAGTASSGARAVLTMAMPRGFANSKSEQYAEPGRPAICRGCTKACNYAEAYDEALEERGRLYKRMSSDKTSRQEAGCAASSFRAWAWWRRIADPRLHRIEHVAIVIVAIPVLPWTPRAVSTWSHVLKLLARSVRFVCQQWRQSVRQSWPNEDSRSTASLPEGNPKSNKLHIISHLVGVHQEWP